MSDITKIDKNFAIETNIQRRGLKFFDPEDEPFSIHGIFREGDKFVRLPEKVAETVSPGVHAMHMHLTGGRVRFVTDSPYVVIKAKYNVITRMDHFALTGSAGIDLYADGIYVNTYRVPYDITDTLEGVIDFNAQKKRLVDINLPTYSGLDKFYIGLCDDCVLEKAPEYKIKKPVVFYGSSITHGGCCSRPGMTYQAQLQRRIDFDYVNLGFSGCAKGEDEIADYISSLDMSLFVYDYDHNAPSCEHLLKTHERMFLRFREKHPTTPVIMMTRPQFIQDKAVLDRLEIIKKTYENALARGDKNVYFIEGKDLVNIAGRDCSVDGCHPTDFGFWNMAKTLGDVIEANYDKIFG